VTAPGRPSLWARITRYLAPIRARVPRTRLLGSRGERLAERFLKRAGYRILARNARVPFGEADLICQDPDGQTIVLVEVKTRAAAHDAPWTPEHAIDPHKRRQLAAILTYLVKANRWHSRPRRIDVIAIDDAESATPNLRHHRHAVPTGR